MKPKKYTNIYIVLILIFGTLSFVKAQFSPRENSFKSILESPLQYVSIPHENDNPGLGINSNNIVLTDIGKKYRSVDFYSKENILAIAADPGSISTSASLVCDGSNITINNVTAASGAGFLASYHYTLQVSNDNGVTWVDASEETTTSSFQLTVYEGSMKIRRKVRIGGLVAGETMFTLPIDIQVIKNHYHLQLSQ